jgi:hypothetical protein
MAFSRASIGILAKADSFSCAYPNVGTDTIYGTGTTNSNLVPAYGLYNYSESAHIVPQTSIGTGKRLNRIAFYYTGWTIPYTFSAVEIWIGHTTNAEFPVGVSVGYAGMTITNLTKVYSGSFTISANNTWMFVDFNPLFCYNGTDNLIVLFKNYDGSWTSGYGNTQNTATANYRQAYVYQDPSYPANGTAMTRALRQINIRLWY